ncbi:signal peptidase I [Candidatus Parcubacteria bacterium]|nr:signal peptidase I [Candidatus Parcubacteria bacterium]
MQSGPHFDQGTAGRRKDLLKKSLLFVWEFLKIALVAAIIILPVRYFLFQPFIVKGESMIPNLQSGDYLIVDEISYRFTPPARGDIVVLKYPLDTTQRFIKRVIGLPGETVEIRNGKVVIVGSDGKEVNLDEKTYLPDLKTTDGDVNVTLSPDNYFVLGDNRQFSYDSRRWGILPKEDIIGKAVFRVLPVTSMKYISTPKY